MTRSLYKSKANQKNHFLFDDCVIDFDFVKMSAIEIAHFNGCVLIFSVSINPKTG